MRWIGSGTTLRALSLCLFALLAACGQPGVVDDDGGDGSASTDSDAMSDAPLDTASTDDAHTTGSCLDMDGDGYGTNCALGPDCDDNDASVTDACYRCMRPAAGCPCSTPGERRACNPFTDGDMPDPDGTCHLGERACGDDHQWSRCVAVAGGRIITPPTSCNNTCNPSCEQTTVCPTSSSDLANGTGVVLGSSTLGPPCPTGTTGGVALQPDPGMAMGGTSNGPPTCATRCNGECCAAGSQCYTGIDQQPDPLTPNWCGNGASRVPPPPVVTDACGITCAAGTTHCGVPPFDNCCAAGQQCRFGVCRTPGGGCTRDSDCGTTGYCSSGVCFPLPTSSCGCSMDSGQAGCMRVLLAQGGEVVSDIFHTTDGIDARFLRFGTYLDGLDFPATTSGSCRLGVTPSPASCGSATCQSDSTNVATIGQYANALDWKWTQHTRYDASGNAIAASGGGTNSNFVPARSRIYDLGAAANRVVLFPVTRFPSGDCMESMGFTVWMTDNPTATTIAGTTHPDPSQWNPTSLTKIFTQGWTRNPLSTGSPTDVTDLTSTANGDAQADGMTTVWALPCGFEMRYVAVSSGNNGVPTSACSNPAVIDRLDAVAGLDQQGHSLMLYHRLRYGDYAGPDGLSFSTTVRSADVYFLFDTTGSMGGELDNLQASLTSGTITTGCPGGVIGGIRCVIPDAWFGVGHHDDFPLTPYGVAGTDVVYQNHLDITSDTASVQSAVNALNIHNGYDGPESQVPSLYAIATGTGFSGYLNNRTGCPAGRFGYPCFRPGRVPIVMLFTDAPFHNGPANVFPYEDPYLFGYSTSVSYPGTATAVTNNDGNTSKPALTIAETTAGQWSGTTNTLSLINDIDPPATCAAGGSRDAAFKVTLTQTRTIRAETSGSGYDTVLFITRASDGAVVACNDDFYSDFSSRITITLPPGTYTFWVDGYGGAAGSYRFKYGIVPAGSTGPTTPTFTDAVTALNNIGAKVVVVSSCNGQSWCSGDAESHARALANQTNSLVSNSTTPAVYLISDTGSGLGSAVVQAVNDLAGSLRMDVTAVAQDNPATPSVDERCFVMNPSGTPAGTVRLSDTSRGESRPYASGQCVDPPGTSPGGAPITARQCLPDAQIDFRAEFLNNCVMQTGVDQIFTFDIVTYGNGTYELGRTPVTIVVPRVTYPASGSIYYDVDAQSVCPVGQQPDWTTLDFAATTPNGTTIRIDAQTAATSAGLTGASIVNLGTAPPATTPISNISATLLAAGQGPHDRFLRVTFTLNSNATRDAAPTLQGYRVQFNCVDGT